MPHMNPFGVLLYKDQATAERAADRHRTKYLRLIERLREANEAIDSLELDRILSAAEIEINT